MKQEFEMTQEEMDNIIAINKNQMPVMVIGDVVTGNEVRERVNNYWMGLGDKYGFKWDTVEGSAKGKLFFLAEPKLKVIPKTPEEISMEKYDTIKKIVDHLEYCNFECIAGSLKNNIAFMALKHFYINL